MMGVVSAQGQPACASLLKFQSGYRGFWQYLRTGASCNLFVQKDERTAFGVSAFSFADLSLFFFGARFWI